MATKEVCSWRKFDRGIEAIANYIKTSPFVAKNIYGIPRGGLVLAVALSHKLKIPITDNPTIWETVIVDDIADTGKTLEKFKGYFITTLYYHKQSKVKPHFWVFEKKKKWIVYPWE